jgi:hypothetical protein
MMTNILFFPQNTVQFIISSFCAAIMFMSFVKHVQKFRRHVWAGWCCSVRVQAAAEHGSTGSIVSCKNVKFIVWHAMQAQGALRYSSTLSLTRALDGCEWSWPYPDCLATPPIVQETGWASWPVWVGMEDLSPTGVWTPDSPVWQGLWSE